MIKIHEVNQQSFLAELYLGLLKKCLTRTNFNDRRVVKLEFPRGSLKWLGYQPLLRLAEKRKKEILLVDAENTRWPANAETMLSLKRLDNIQFCVKDVLNRNVPGDLIEAGVWRGAGQFSWPQFSRLTMRTKEKFGWLTPSKDYRSPMN